MRKKWWIIIVIVLLILLVLFLGKSCGKKKQTETVNLQRQKPIPLNGEIFLPA